MNRAYIKQARNGSVRAIIETIHHAANEQEVEKLIAEIDDRPRYACCLSGG